MTGYNHMFTIAFALENNSPDGGDTTKEELFAALERRLRELRKSPEEIIEACGMPCDTYEVPPEREEG